MFLSLLSSLFLARNKDLSSFTDLLKTLYTIWWCIKWNKSFYMSETSGYLDYRLLQLSNNNCIRNCIIFPAWTMRIILRIQFVTEKTQWFKLMRALTETRTPSWVTVTILLCPKEDRHGKPDLCAHLDYLFNGRVHGSLTLFPPLPEELW